LVDGGTASAAEVVAAALQQNGRAPLVGIQTFGKGSVQVILPLREGSRLHETAPEWYTPNAGTLEGVGLALDVRVEQTGRKDALLSAARDWLKQHPGGLH
jgi:carboxyl-terminal processing protease